MKLQELLIKLFKIGITLQLGLLLNDLTKTRVDDSKLLLTILALLKLVFGNRKAFGPPESEVLLQQLLTTFSVSHQ